MQDHYRVVPDFPNYVVTRNGSIWSIPRDTRAGLRGGRFLRPRRKIRNDRGAKPWFDRMQVKLWGPSGTCRYLNVGAVVLLAFVGPRPAGHECCHADGNPANNRVGNLRWGTAADNHDDMVRHGRSTRGERNPRAKLTAEHVRKIRSATGTNAGIARRFGIARSTVSEIRSGQKWKHVH